MPFSQRKKIVISRTQQTTKISSSRFSSEIARSSPTELSAKAESKGGRDQSLLINETSDSQQTASDWRTVDSRARAACKLFDLFKFLASILNFAFRFIIPFARRIDLDNGCERILVLKIIASANSPPPPSPHPASLSLAAVDKKYLPGLFRGMHSRRISRAVGFDVIGNKK